MYDPSTARFLSKDPMEDAGGSPNLYLYCANDPVNNTDPSGQDGLKVVGDKVYWTMSGLATDEQQVLIGTKSGKYIHVAIPRAHLSWGETGRIVTTEELLSNYLTGGLKGVYKPYTPDRPESARHYAEHVIYHELRLVPPYFAGTAQAASPVPAKPAFSDAVKSAQPVTPREVDPGAKWNRDDVLTLLTANGRPEVAEWLVAEQVILNPRERFFGVVAGSDSGTLSPRGNGKSRLSINIRDDATNQDAVAHVTSLLQSTLFNANPAKASFADWLAARLDASATKLNDREFEDRVQQYSANMRRNVAEGGQLAADVVKVAYTLPSGAAQAADLVIELTDKGLEGLNWTHVVPLIPVAGRLIIKHGGKVFTISAKDAAAASRADAELRKWAQEQAAKKAQALGSGDLAMHARPKKPTAAPTTQAEINAPSGSSTGSGSTASKSATPATESGPGGAPTYAPQIQGPVPSPDGRGWIDPRTGTRVPAPGVPAKWQAEFDALPDVVRNGQTLKERYLNELATKGANARSPAEFGKSALKNWANADKGSEFQNEVRDVLGVARGTGSGHHDIGGYRIDLPPGQQYGVTDIKNVKELEKTPQIKAFIKYAKDNGLPVNFIVSPETKYISSTIIADVRATGGKIVEYNPTTGKFTTLNLPKTGVWER